MLSLTRSLAVLFGPDGIRTNAICPGPVETPLLMDWLLKDGAAKQLRLARNPTGRSIGTLDTLCSNRRPGTRAEPLAWALRCPSCRLDSYPPRLRI